MPTRNRRQILKKERLRRFFAAGLCLLAGWIVVRLVRAQHAPPAEPIVLHTVARTEPLANRTETPRLFPVHISGAVRRPGVYRVSEGTIVQDLLDLAGGPSDDAALDGINLAALLEAHMKCHIPTAAESEAQGDGAPDFLTLAESPDRRVNINRADRDELMRLPGVGPATAEAILRYREANGAFETPDDLMLVPGIKQAKFDAMAPFVVVP